MAAARNRTIALLITLVALVAACSREKPPSTPAAQLGTAPAEAATTEAPSELAASEPPSEPADPYAIPADPKDIDAAYVEGVLEALSGSVAKAARILVREGALTDEAKRSLRSAHTGKALSGILSAFNDALRRGKPTDFFSADAGPVSVKVNKIITAKRDCIWTLVTVNNDALGGKEVRPFPTYYFLVAKGRGDDPGGANPTPWMIAGDGAPLPGGKEYANPCG